MIIYNKLIRDKIDAQIAETGKRVVTTIVTGEELQAAMRRKIVEEAQELAGATTQQQIAEEIGDLLEIINAYRKNAGISQQEVQAAMVRKSASKGAFDKGKFLISVSDESIVDMVKRKS